MNYLFVVKKEQIYVNIAELPSCHNRYIGYSKIFLKQDSKIFLKQEGILCLESHCTVIAVMSVTGVHDCVCKIGVFNLVPLLQCLYTCIVIAVIKQSNVAQVMLCKNLGRLQLAYADLQGDFTCCNSHLLTLGTLQSQNSANGGSTTHTSIK